MILSLISIWLLINLFVVVALMPTTQDGARP